MRVISYYWIHPDDGMPQIDKTERSKESSKEKRRRFYVTDKRRKNMKNSNLFKKFAAIAMTAALILSSTVISAFAATDVTIGGLEAKVTPTAYKLATVKTNGAVERAKNAAGEYIITEGMVKDFEDLQTEEILKLAANTPDGLETVTGAQTTGSTATLPQLEPGIYLVKFAATEDVKYVYNPVIISVDKDGNALSGNVGEGNLANYNKVEVQVKKSTVPFEKVVERDEDRLVEGKEGSNPDNTLTAGDDAKVDADKKDGVDGNRGDTAGKGDRVNFRINTTVPYYADNFFTKDQVAANTTVTVAPQFEVYDELNGLTLDQTSIVVYANRNFDTALEEGEAKDYTLVKSATGFTVKLTEKAIKAYRGQDIEVRYAATVNDNAERVNFNPDSNTAGCRYSNNPNSTTKAEVEKRTTYHYKFTINGKIQGNDGEWNREVIKVGLDEHGDQILMETTDGKMTQKGWNPLDGVTFKLYNADQSKVVRDNVISEDGGVLKGMDQLDAGTYYLIEDDPQAEFGKDGAYEEKNYTPNTNPIKIEIEAKLLDDGRLDSYQVRVADQVVGHYKADYTKDYGANGTIIRDDAGDFFSVSGTFGSDSVVPIIDHRHNITKPDGTVLEGDWDFDYDVAADIVNTKIGTLPSTGGIGTVIFTVGGIAIMALALFLLFGGKKKQEQK